MATLTAPLPVTIPYYVGPILLPSAQGVGTASAGTDDLEALVLQALSPGAEPFNVLADLAEALPAPLDGPDATPSVPTGASDISRAEAFTYAALAAVPRLVDTVGAPASGVAVAGVGTFAIVETYDDPASGFDAVQLRSLTDGRTIFAVDGTDFNSLPDVVAALDLARPQAVSPAFAAMVADAGAAALGEGREVVFTGASLGGALAQVAGYETAEAIRAASPGYAGSVTVFGVDPLGGRDAAESLNGGALDPAVLGRLDALNIRTEGDIVSRVGSHLGDTLTLRAVDAAGGPVVLSAQDAHVNLPSLFANLSSDALFASGTRGDPGEVSGLTLLANAFGSDLGELLSDPALAGLLDQPASAAAPAGVSFDPAGGYYDLDANRDGLADLRVFLGGSDDLLIA